MLKVRGLSIEIISSIYIHTIYIDLSTHVHVYSKRLVSNKPV